MPTAVGDVFALFSPMRSTCVRALILTIIFLTAGVAVRAEDSAPQWPSAEEVLDRLKSTHDWYQQTRQTMQMAKEAAVILAAREDEQAVLRIVQHGFDAARAQAALVEQTAAGSAAPAAATNPAMRRAERRAKLETAIREGGRELERLRERVRHAPAARRAALERELTALANRLALDRMQLELITSLQQAETSLASGDAAVMKMMGRFRPASFTARWTSSPPRMGIRISRSRQDGTSGSGRARNSVADENDSVL